MKKIYLLSLALLLPTQAMSVEQDSVYNWGNWSQGIKPAAGPSNRARVTPPPVTKPNTNFRPNENSAFSRSVAQTPPVVAPIVVPTPPRVVVPPVVSIPTAPVVTAIPTATVVAPTGDPRARGGRS